MTLTLRQERIMLPSIQREIAEKGEAPRLTDIASAAGLKAKSHVNRLLTSLAEAGFITRERYGKRAITISKPVIDDRFEAAARAACEAVGADPEKVGLARAAIVSVLVTERQAA